jgi:hypothetical protein
MFKVTTCFSHFIFSVGNLGEINNQDQGSNYHRPVVKSAEIEENTTGGAVRLPTFVH